MERRDFLKSAAGAVIGACALSGVVAANAERVVDCGVGQSPIELRPGDIIFDCDDGMLCYQVSELPTVNSYQAQCVDIPGCPERAFSF